VSADRRPAGPQPRQPDAAVLAAGLIAVAEDLAGEFSLRRLGATIDVDSLAGWGTRIRARFPYRQHDEQAGPRLRRLHVGARDTLQDAEHAPIPLTERERQVRSLMEQGLPDKLIAEQLVLSIKTVEKHAGAVLRKTGARNRTELAARANHARTRAGG
jgi:DNA-binding CsgD family transcriptional regulator